MAGAAFRNGGGTTEKASHGRAVSNLRSLRSQEVARAQSGANAGDQQRKRLPRKTSPVAVSQTRSKGFGSSIYLGRKDFERTSQSPGCKTFIDQRVLYVPL